MDKNFNGTREEYLEFREKANERNKKYYAKPEVKERKKIYKTQYDIDNKEKIKEYGKKLRSRKEYKERVKKWRKDNKKHLKEYTQTVEYKKKKSESDKRYRDKNKNKKWYIERERKRGKEFRENNQEKIRKYNQKYYTSPKGIISYTNHNHRRLALIKSRPCDLTNKKVKQLFERDKVCVYCGSDKSLELDHIIPLKLGGHSLFVNFVIACAKCNRTKNDREVIYWCKLKGIEVPKIVLTQLEKMKK